jgi:anti-sigma B factor antagonist
MNEVIKEVREADSGALVVVAGGDITLDQSPAFHKALKKICDRSPKHLVIELSNVSHIDSAGVGTLVDVFRRVRNAKGRMSLAGMNRQVRGVFEITKLDTFFPIFDTEQEALAS